MLGNLQFVNYEPITLTLLAAFAAAGLWAVLTRRYYALIYQFMLGLSLGGFNTYRFSTVWSPTKVTTIFILLSLLTARRVPLRFRRNIRPELLVMLVVGLLASTIAAFMFYLPINFAAGLQSATVRPLVQAYSYLSIIALAPFAVIALDSAARVRAAIRMYMYIALGSVAVALLQFAVLLAGGSFMPIIRMTGRNSQMAAFNVGGHLVTRLYAFAGEPKSLAVVILPALLIAFITYGGRLGRRLPIWASIPGIALLACVLVFTFSTAAFLALGLIAIPLVLTIGRFYPTTMLKSALSVGAAIFILGTAYAYSRAGATSDDIPTLSDVVYARSAGRVQGEWQDRHEYDAIVYLAAKPAAWPFGLGPGMYNFHIPGLLSGSIIEPLDAGWLVVLLDLGLFGLVVLLTWIISTGRAAWRFADAAMQRRDAEALWSVVAASTAFLGSAVLFVGISSPSLLATVLLFGGIIEAIILTSGRATSAA